jgi:hypothetical protein
VEGFSASSQLETGQSELQQQCITLKISFLVLKREMHTNRLHLPFTTNGELHDTQQPQNNEDDHNDEQGVDNVAAAWKAGEHIRAKISEQPKYEQNYNNPGKHEISPFLICSFYNHHTINTPRPHPSAGECLSPPLGGED